MRKHKPEFIEHNGVRILRVDFSECEGVQAMLDLMDAAMPVIALELPLSILMLTRWGPPLCQVTYRATQKYAQHNARYVKASAIVGLNQLQRTVLWPMVAQRAGKVATFNDERAALDWLSSQ